MYKRQLYISHKLEEIRALCDNATILRNGKNVGVCFPKTEPVRNIAEMMVGKKLSEPKKGSTVTNVSALQVENLNWISNDFSNKQLTKINFTVNKGEILGIGGVAGNGQDELTSILSGELQSNKNAIKFFGEPIGDLDINKRRLMGILTAPEERLGLSLIHI